MLPKNLSLNSIDYIDIVKIMPEYPVSDVMKIDLMTDGRNCLLLFYSNGHDKGFILISVTSVYSNSMKNQESFTSLHIIILTAD